MKGQRFRLLPDKFAVGRLPYGSPWPAWATGSFVSVTATADELSVVCEASAVPANVTADREWRVLKIIGPFDLKTTGVLASLATPLAQAGISVLAIATYDTDYLLVRSDSVDRAVNTLLAAGHAQID